MINAETITTLNAEIQELQATLDSKRATFEKLVFELRSVLASIPTQSKRGANGVNKTGSQRGPRPITANFKGPLTGIFKNHPTTENRSVVEALVNKSLASVSRKNHCDVPEEILTLVEAKLSAYSSN